MIHLNNDEKAGRRPGSGLHASSWPKRAYLHPVMCLGQRLTKRPTKMSQLTQERGLGDIVQSLIGL